MAHKKIPKCKVCGYALITVDGNCLSCHIKTQGGKMFTYGTKYTEPDTYKLLKDSLTVEGGGDFHVGNWPGPKEPDVCDFMVSILGYKLTPSQQYMIQHMNQHGRKYVFSKHTPIFGMDVKDIVLDFGCRYWEVIQ